MPRQPKGDFDDFDKRVLLLIAHGNTDKQIATELDAEAVLRHAMQSLRRRIGRRLAGDGDVRRALIARYAIDHILDAAQVADLRSAAQEAHRRLPDRLLPLAERAIRYHIRPEYFGLSWSELELAVGWSEGITIVNLLTPIAMTFGRNDMYVQIVYYLLWEKTS